MDMFEKPENKYIHMCFPVLLNMWYISEPLDFALLQTGRS